VQPPGPRIAYLETAAQSYALADGVSDAVWDDAVSWALDNPESFKRVLETSYRAWVDGDFEEVDRINTLDTRNRFTPIKQAVIAARNRLWLPTLRELVQSVRIPCMPAGDSSRCRAIVPHDAGPGLSRTWILSLSS
jgi:uncharacterized protein YbaP (TraB family)